MTRALFVGPLTSRQAGGATVKNGLLVSALRERGVDVEVVDTGASGARARLRQLASLLGALARHDQVMLSVSRNGAVALVSILGLASAVRPRLRCTFLAVGSSLPGNVARLEGLSRRLYVWCLSRCRPVWVEGEWMRRELEGLGVGGVEVLPNPRPPVSERWDPASVSAGRLVFVSRVTPEKGVERAMAAVEELAASGVQAALDVFGPVEETYRPAFEAQLAKHPHTRYRGSIPQTAVAGELAGAAALLLPTTWATEGMPGAVVEAAMVGTPVVASDSPAMAEVVEDGVTGLLIDPTDVSALAAAVRRLLTVPGEAERLGAALRARAGAFTVDAVVSRLTARLSAEGWR